MIVCNNSGVEQCQPRGIFRAAHQPGNQLNRFLQIVDVVDKQGVALTFESRQNPGAQQRGLARARFGEQYSETELRISPVRAARGAPEYTGPAPLVSRRSSSWAVRAGARKVEPNPSERIIAVS
jgi:hypothetical protein